MTTVVGRTGEFAALERVLEAARGGRLGLALVTGEAGIGKSHLVRALAADAAASGFRVLSGACLELGATIAYLPFAEMLRDAVRGLSDQDRAALLGPGGEVVEPLLGFERPGRPGQRHGGADVQRPGGSTVSRPGAADGVVGDAGAVSAEFARLQMFESLLRMTERMAARAPLLVVLEDIQWADRDSLDLVTFLVRNLRACRIALVMTARAGGNGTLPEATASFAAAIERIGRVERLELAPLGEQGMASQLSGLLGRPVEAALAAIIHRRAGGNPLFAEELLAWTESGATWTGSAPPRLRDLVTARLAALPQEAHGVLRLASAAGRMVDDELLVEATGLDAPLVRSGIRAAVVDGILVPARSAGRDGYAFRHDLVREAVAAELLPGERARLHEAFALALTSGRARTVDQGELAYHWDAAGEPARALQAHIAAGVAAREVFGFEVAQHHFERALELWPDVPTADDLTTFDRIDLVQAAALAAAMAGNNAQTIELERALLRDLKPESGDPRVIVALELLRRAMWESGDTAGALAEAERAASVVGDGVTRARASVLAHLAGLYMYTGDLARARDTSIQALEVASAAGAREEQALAGGVLGWSLIYSGQVEDGLGLIQFGAAAAEQIGEVRGRGLAADHLARALEMVGRTDEAAAVAQAGAELCRRSGLARTYGALLAADATRCLLPLGRVADAAGQAEAGLAAGPVGPGHVALLAASALVALEQGRPDDAAAALREAHALAGTSQDIDAIGPLAVAEMGLALQRADPAGALATLRGLPDGGEPGVPLAIVGAGIGPLLRLGTCALADAARLARARGEPADPDGPGGTGGPGGGSADRDRLERMLHFLQAHEDLRRAHEVDLAIAAAEFARAGSPTAPETVLAWREALAMEAAHPSRTPQARAYADLRLAEALVLAPGGRAEATALVHDALALAAGAGYVVLASELRLLARRARLPLEVDGTASDVPGGAGPDGRPGPGAALGLTEREAEVLRLVAGGLTNREIGERLFISPKTASVHVSAILAKLGVDGRLEAALVAQQLGLVVAGADTS